MIRREDILSMEYLKKTQYTGSHQGMRYRLEQITAQESEGPQEKKLKVTVWPEPFCYLATPDEKKKDREFPFSEEGVEEAVEWMNALLRAEQG